MGLGVREAFLLRLFLRTLRLWLSLRSRRRSLVLGCRALFARILLGTAPPRAGALGGSLVGRGTLCGCLGTCRLASAGFNRDRIALNHRGLSLLRKGLRPAKPRPVLPGDSVETCAALC